MLFDFRQHRVRYSLEHFFFISYSRIWPHTPCQKLTAYKCSSFSAAVLHDKRCTNLENWVIINPTRVVLG